MQTFAGVVWMETKKPKETKPSEVKLTKQSKIESLERLQSQLSLAVLSGDTSLQKKLKDIIKYIKERR